MLNYQVIGASLFLLLFPSSSRIFVLLLLLIRVLFLFTSLKHSFKLSRVLIKFGIMTFVSASLFIFWIVDFQVGTILDGQLYRSYYACFQSLDHRNSILWISGDGLSTVPFGMYAYILINE